MWKWRYCKCGEVNGWEMSQGGRVARAIARKAKNGHLFGCLKSESADEAERKEMV